MLNAPKLNPKTLSLNSSLMARSHCTEPEPGNGKGNNGFLYYMFTVHTALRQGQEPDPLSPIVLVPFPVPVPVPVPVPCSVNKP